MATYAFAITKTIMWRGVQTPFSNVYHYSNLSEAADFGAILDQLRDIERPIHATTVTFIQGRAWGPTDQGQAASVTKTIKDYNLAGTHVASSSMYREAALLLQWPLGRYGNRARPQFLRKWLHAGHAGSYSDNGSDAMTNPSAAMTTYNNSITTPPVGGPLAAGVLSTAQGKPALAGGTWYKYLEHRQLGR